MTLPKGSNPQDLNVPFLVHESDMARLSKANEQLVKQAKSLEEENKRLHKTIRTLVIAFCATLVLLFTVFTIYESQFETVSENSTSTTINSEVSQNDSDNNTLNIVGGDTHGADR